MNPVDAAEAVQYANLELACEDSFAAAGDRYVLEVPVDPRITAAYTVRAILTSQDAIFRVGPLALDAKRVFYGWLLEGTAKPGDFLVLIRGTATATEWWADCQFAQRSYPAGGKVEDGFFGLYERMQARLPGQSAATAELPLISTLSAIVGSGSLTVVGHSLGAVLGNYLSVQAAGPLGNRVRARLFASPRPGDEAFARYASGQVRDCRAYVNPLDLVPKVPEGFDYCELPSTVTLSVMVPLPMPRSAPWMHHLVTYIFLLDPTFDFSTLPPIDAPFLTWLKFATQAPSPATTAVG